MSKGACLSPRDHMLNMLIDTDVTCTPSVLDKVILATHAGTGWQ